MLGVFDEFLVVAGGIYGVAVLGEGVGYKVPRWCVRDSLCLPITARWQWGGRELARIRVFEKSLHVVYHPSKLFSILGIDFLLFCIIFGLLLSQFFDALLHLGEQISKLVIFNDHRNVSHFCFVIIGGYGCVWGCCCHR